MGYAGSVLAHGVDLLHVDSFTRLFDGARIAHLTRYFTEAELASVGSDSRRCERLASRFAIKESVLKALGTGWGDGVSFKDVEVMTSAVGAPSVMLHRKLRTVAATAGIDRWLVSAAHASGLVMASVIGYGAETVP
jgi:holo-[acyl-carrier protein] synthase